MHQVLSTHPHLNHLNLHFNSPPWCTDAHKRKITFSWPLSLFSSPSLSLSLSLSLSISPEPLILPALSMFTLSSIPSLHPTTHFSFVILLFPSLPLSFPPSPALPLSPFLFLHLFLFFL